MPISTDKKWLKDRDKVTSGFCNEFGKPGQHEGQKPKSGTKPLPTCEAWLTCPCECHQRIDQMFEMTKMERQLVPNPEYIPDRGDFKPPEEIASPVADVAPEDGGIIDAPDVERLAAATGGPVLAPLAERRTGAGYAYRGALEAQVWEACAALEVEVGNEDPITPKLVAEWIISKYEGIPTPSSGAIAACWDRWEKADFATQAKKPVRFTGFVGDGTWGELQRIKNSKKLQQKAASTQARLTVRQPEKRKR